MPFIAENWGELLTPGLRKIYTDYFQEMPSNISMLFNEQTSTKAQEFDLEDGPIEDFEEFNGQVQYDDAVQGYKTTYTHEELVRGFKVERKLIDDDLYNVINRKPAKLAMGARRRREADAASVFNDAFNTSVTYGDSLALCHNSHTSKQGAATQDNRFALALTPINVEVNRRLMRKFRDPIGGTIQIEPDLLLAPMELEDKAFEIINSKGKVDTALNNANFHFGKYKLLVWANYLTDAAAWFLIDSRMMKQALNWFDRVKPEFFRDKDFETLQSKFAGYMRYSYGPSDWRWIAGSTTS